MLGEGDIPLFCLSLGEQTVRGDVCGTSWLLYCCEMGNLHLQPQKGDRGAALLTRVFPFAAGAGTWGLSNCLIVRQRGRLSHGAGPPVQPVAARGIPAAERLPASSLAGSAHPQHVPPVHWEPRPSTLQPPAADAQGEENLPKGASGVHWGRSGPGHMSPQPGGLLALLQPAHRAAGAHSSCS